MVAIVLNEGSWSMLADSKKKKKEKTEERSNWYNKILEQVISTREKGLWDVMGGFWQKWR